MRWLLGFGSVCLVAALALLFAASQSEAGTTQSNAEIAANEELCRARLGSGDESGATGEACEAMGRPAVDRRTQLSAASLVLAVLGLSQVLAAFRVGVTASGPGVTIRNPLRTHRLLWSDIERFRVERGAAGPMSYSFGRVELVDGRSHRIEAVCAMPWEPNRGFADEYILDELNAELARHRRMPAGGMDLDGSMSDPASDQSFGRRVPDPDSTTGVS